MRTCPKELTNPKRLSDGKSTVFDLAPRRGLENRCSNADDSKGEKISPFKFMLPRLLRLPPLDARRVRLMGKHIDSRDLELSFVKDTEAEFFKWYVVIPKKGVKLSTARNRWRRVIHQAIVVLKDDLSTGGKGVVRLKRAMFFPTTRVAQERLKMLLAKARLLKES